MERSIENIWKEGFEAEGSLSIPVIKNLYRRKSKLIIDKIRATSKKDNISLIPIGLVMILIFVFIGKALLGAYIGLLIFSLFFLNRKNLAELDKLDVTSNTYQYLQEYYTNLKGLQKYYTRLLGFGLPLLIVPGYWLYFEGTPIMAHFKSLEITSQIAVILLVSISLSILGIMAYKLSTRVLYGKLIIKLEEIVEEMRDLRKT